MGEKSGLCRMEGVHTEHLLRHESPKSVTKAGANRETLTPGKEHGNGNWIPSDIRNE